MYKKVYTEKQLTKYDKFATDIRENYSFGYVEKYNGDAKRIK